MLRERLSVCGRYHSWIFYSWPYRENTHAVPHDKLLRYTWGSAYQAFRTVTSMKLFPWINSHGGPSSVGLQFCGTELIGRKPGGLQLQLPMKVPLEPSQRRKINPLCVWLLWPTLAFPLDWEEFAPEAPMWVPPRVICTRPHVWGPHLQVVESQQGKLHFDPERSTQKQNRSAFYVHYWPTQGTIVFSQLGKYHFGL